MKNIPVSQRVVDMLRKRRIRRLRFFIFFTFLFLLLIGATAYFSFHKNITLDKVVVKGTSIIDPIDVATKVEQILNGRYFFIYSRANSFIYPQKQIHDDLIMTFPRIEELSIVREGLNVLNIEIKERLGSYLYCGNTIPELKSLIGENCYFVNNDGYVFDKAPYFSGSVYFKFYVKLKNNDSPLRENIIEQDRFHELIRFIDEITFLGFKPIYLLIEEDGTHSLYLDNHSSDISPVVLFRDDNNLENILNNLKTAMNKKEFRDEINSKYDSLLYIDLRFKSKVLYKFQ